MENTEHCAKMESRVTVKMGGVELIAMVCMLWIVTPDFYSYSRTVCKSDNACKGFPLAGGIYALDEGTDDKPANMTCYTGGETVFNNHQMCNVTSAYLPLLVVLLLNASSSLQTAKFWTCSLADPRK